MIQTKHNLFTKLLAISFAAYSFGLHQLYAEEDAAHDVLRTMRKELIEAANTEDLESMLKHTHPNVVITWQNNEVCRGHDGTREFFQRMGKGAFKSYKVDPEADELTIIYGGDTGISFGKSVGTYSLLGKEFEFHNRWTATLVKEDGVWLMAAYHVSLNALDNPILNAAKGSFYTAITIGIIFGIIVGFLIFRRKKS